MKQSIYIIHTAVYTYEYHINDKYNSWVKVMHNSKHIENVAIDPLQYNDIVMILTNMKKER